MTPTSQKAWRHSSVAHNRKLRQSGPFPTQFPHVDLEPAALGPGPCSASLRPAPPNIHLFQHQLTSELTDSSWWRLLRVSVSIHQQLRWSRCVVSSGLISSLALVQKPQKSDVQPVNGVLRLAAPSWVGTREATWRDPSYAHVSTHLVPLIPDPSNTKTSGGLGLPKSCSIVQSGPQEEDMGEGRPQLLRVALWRLKSIQLVWRSYRAFLIQVY